MKCENCKEESLYIYKLTQNTAKYYCKKHLPRFLEPLRKAGNLQTTEAFKRKSKEAIAALQGKTAPTVVEEPKVEEPQIEEIVEAVAEVVEEPVVQEETPKPRKKSKPKAELAEDEVNS